MTDKKGDTTASSTTSNSKNTPKKANLLDHHSIKHLLDESVTEIVTGKGFIEDVRMSNIRLLMGSVIIIIALFAQFYNKKFPENRNFLIGCIVLFTKDGVLVEGLFWKDVEGLVNEYTRESKKSK